MWAFSHLGMRLFGNSGIWSFVPLVNCAFGHVVIRAFGNMGIWSWLFGHVFFGQLGI